MTQHYTIIGHPLGHTMSPKLHNWGFAQQGVDAQYSVSPTQPGQLENFVHAMRTTPIAGASVTIPHKEAIIPLLDAITPRAHAVGAVNTLYWDNDQLTGDNTDIAGFIAPLLATPKNFSRALILGAGGAAKAVVAGLCELGVSQITICNRSKNRAEALAREFSVSFVEWEVRGNIDADLIVNTTPLGMEGENVGLSPYPKEAFRDKGTAYDLIYNPLQTRFLTEASSVGWDIVDGLHMFAGQGIEQFRIWTGHTLSVPEVRQLIATELSR